MLPEKFETSINFKPDGSYTYKYDGTAVNAFVVIEIHENGALSEKDEAELKRDAEEAAKTPGIKKMTYTGEGRFNVVIEQDLKPGQVVIEQDLKPDQPATTVEIFTVTQGKDGVFVVAVPTIEEKVSDQLRVLGIKVDGKMNVFLPSNAKVLAHNASGTPGLLSKSYSWHIGALSDQPSIKFTLEP
ncbi:hypothetical protein AwPolaro_09280 [Polaromonas sp.]|nr:hypothetical protein AwPolaro_09280 [Polaromonas sp.]